MLLPRSGLLICARCIRVEVARRGKSTIAPQNKQTWLSKFSTWFRYTFGEAKGQSFTKDVITYVHRKDKLLPSEWVLIYNDVMYVRFRFLMCALLPTVFTTAIYGLQDYNKNNGKFSNVQLETLRRDLYMAGMLKYPILLMMMCSFSALIRNLQIRVYRIYQNIQDPYKYYVFRSKSLIFSEWVIVPRSAIKTNDILYDFAERAEQMGRGRRVLRRWLYGHATIGNRKAVIEEIFFRSNNLRTFMLNETNIVPKQITDIQQKMLELGKAKR